MIDETDQRDFNVSFDKKEPDSEHAREFLEGKVDSLRWKVLLLSIIVPCLIAVIVVVGYFSIQEKVINFRDIGTTEVQQLSHILETRMADLSRQQQTLQSQVEGVLPQTKDNRTDIKNIQYNLNISKKSRENLKQRLTELEEAKAPLDNRVAVLSQSAEKTTERIAVFKEELRALQATAESIIKEKANRDELERVVAAYEQKLLKKIDTLSAGLENQIATLARKLPTSKTSSTSTPTPPPPTSAGPSNPPEATSPPPPGGIIEKDLSE